MQAEVKAIRDAGGEGGRNNKKWEGNELTTHISLL